MVSPSFTNWPQWLLKNPLCHHHDRYLTTRFMNKILDTTTKITHIQTLKFVHHHITENDLLHIIKKINKHFLYNQYELLLPGSP